MNQGQPNQYSIFNPDFSWLGPMSVPTAPPMPPSTPTLQGPSKPKMQDRVPGQPPQVPQAPPFMTPQQMMELSNMLMALKGQPGG